MAVADKIIANFDPHKRPTETVVSAFTATTHNQLWVTVPVAVAGVGALLFDRYANSLVWVVVPLLTLLPVVWFLMVNQNYTVIATNERTVVADASTFGVLQVDSIHDEFAADVQIGPTSGLIYTTGSLGQPLRIHRRAFAQVRRADARRGGEIG